jgi:hypothetical protein
MIIPELPTHFTGDLRFKKSRHYIVEMWSPLVLMGSYSSKIGTMISYNMSRYIMPATVLSTKKQDPNFTCLDKTERQRKVCLAVILLFHKLQYIAYTFNEHCMLCHDLLLYITFGGPRKEH